MYSEAENVIVAHEAEISQREEAERQMDNALVTSALTAMDEWLNSLLC